MQGLEAPRGVPRLRWQELKASYLLLLMYKFSLGLGRYRELTTLNWSTREVPLDLGRGAFESKFPLQLQNQTHCHR